MSNARCLSHQDLVHIGYRLLLNQFGCGVAFKDLVAYTRNGETADVLGIKGIWETYLIECKTSRSDFLSDHKKSFRKSPELGMGMFRYYLAPEGLISVSELPDRWGLIEVTSQRRCKVVHGKPPKQVASINSPFYFPERCEISEASIMYSALRRLQKLKLIEQIYDPVSG